MIPNLGGDMLPEGYTISYELAKRVVDHALILRRFTRRAAELYLDKYLPDVEGNDREWILNHYAETNLRRPLKPQPSDPLFCAAMFLAGVSYGDLCMLYGITKQSMAQKIQRRTSPQDRAMRDAPAMLDLEVIELAKKMYEDALKVDASTFNEVHPMELGRALLKAACRVVTEDRGTDEVPDRPRRYANMNISPVPEVPPDTPPPATEPEPRQLVSPAQSVADHKDSDDATLYPPRLPNILNPAEADFLKGL